MSLRYIGSKARVAAEIGAVLGRWRGRGRFVDAFCGTGVVARQAADLGWPLWLNDHLVSSATVATAQAIARSDVPFRSLHGYEEAIATLDATEGVSGFVWREYSPASAAQGIERRYFTEHNAARIDAIRSKIASWESTGTVTPIEAKLLVADLLAATDRVANIAGTYGCFLRNWTPNSRRALQLVARVLPRRSSPLEVSYLDVFDVATRPEDTVYLDPPYTKRQYAAYYHLLETIAEGDAPDVKGITGLRPWEHKASAFCYKTRALPALISLVANLEARRVLLSYSDEGHVSLEALKTDLSHFGDLRVHQLATIGRYRPNERASANGASVVEYLLELRRSPPRRSSVLQRRVRVAV